ncbi:peptide-methionine (S)-S-oxide reductase [Lebetimonas natsushimae]|uniref:peptide-methionine (S)-S-oxide reductase n=1 Tax=Lebetimonas natsushimae TaxID=1936991 RepID=A0A292YCS9_9BACT|nr:peptide-methionine (S)-S-oxide reductase [Lebetimonas natsushimae]GAX87508.1 peptide-methionine (S)-S-oxide reductase [Lebetimonas natsushimae]
MDAVFGKVEGIKNVICRYSEGREANPTYEQVCSGVIGDAEVVMIDYDENNISYEDLFDVFFEIYYSTQLNKRGNDIGT